MERWSSSSAGKKLDRAFDKLGEKKSLSFELDLDTDAASLKALDAKSEPAPGEGDTGRGRRDDQRREDHVHRAVEEADQRSPVKDFVGMAKVSSPDGDLTEYRLIGDYAYVRADVKALGKVAGSRCRPPMTCRPRPGR
ncbi:hypothetical protein LT493_23835 [Streptomyces tricolor]|nr:hypothetical protein [Streptomyces tricolor]